jgi:mono/diheme cytochrome c family protein
MGLFLVLGLSGCLTEFAPGSLEADNKIYFGGDSGYATKFDLLEDGQAQYERQCAACHGSTGNGGISILESVRGNTAVQKTRQTMPTSNPTACSKNCSMAVIAWLASVNGIQVNIDDEGPLTSPGDNTGPDDGSNTNDGLTDNQRAGKLKYEAQCAACHSTNGDGALANTSSILDSIKEGTAVNYTSLQMPKADPTQCDINCARNVISWVAHVNNLPFDHDSDSQADVELLQESTAETFRRASLLLGAGIPEMNQLEALAGANDSALRAEILTLMEGEGFKNFIKDGANDQLLVRSIGLGDLRFQINNWYKDYEADFLSEDDRDNLSKELKEQPLELINYIIQNDRPYTEILTANYALASDQLARLFKSNVIPAEGEWIEVAHKGQYTSSGRGNASKNWDDATPVEIPQAGVLTTMGFLKHNPTTATNRNRARSRWTMYHFLGYDIEASAPRVKIEDAVDDNNPTLNNPACVVCHETMDPIAAAFRDHGNGGLFRDGDYGQHALSNDYVGSSLFEDGQVWYADVLPAGFEGALMPDNVDALPWLAQQIVGDPRFGPGVIKFWWPAIFGKELYDTESVSELAKQQAFVKEVADEFKANNWDFKQLLADLIMSDWYRTENLTGSLNTELEQPLTYNSKRLLTPEEMSQKYQQLFLKPGDYMAKHYQPFGGIDSKESTIRDRSLNVVKANVMKSNVYEDACAIVYGEFEMDSDDRKLFSLVELNQWPGQVLSEKSKDANSGTKSTEYIAPVEIDSDHQLMFSSATGDARLRRLTITSPSGVVLFNSHVRELENVAGLVLDTNAFRPDGEYRFTNKSKYLNILLPESWIEVGDFVIRTVHGPQTDGNTAAISVNMSSADLRSDISDSNSAAIKAQLALLFERLHGETYPIDHEEITTAYDLFLALQTTAEIRGEHSLVGSDYQCRGVANEIDYDMHFTFSAWKGVLVALATDFNFIVE